MYCCLEYSFVRAFFTGVPREGWCGDSLQSLFEHTRLGLTKEKFDIPRAWFDVHQSVQNLFEFVGNVEMGSIAGGAGFPVKLHPGHLQVLKLALEREILLWMEACVTSDHTRS